MAAASSEEELKSLLVEVGSRLQSPPTSVKDLLTLLDRVEVYLSRVEQSPSKEIQNALSPTMKALVGDELLRHADVDVKVSVASCISEITRITAPEVPYEDDQMKAVFQLIVSSFESLADMSSQSFSKRTSVLETVAKVRSSVVMLDLECDELILEMFRHFIKAIRDNHPENVYSCMESIMTRVIEESEEISSDLLFCIMDAVRKDNKEVRPIAQKLMKRVIEICADKLKPYIEIAMRIKGLSLADYDEVVSLICNEASAETVVQSEHTDASAVDASKPAISTADTVLNAEETQAVAANSIELPAGGCSELVTSNGNAAVEADALSGSSTLQDSKTSNADKASETVTANPSASVSIPDGRGVDTDTKASETHIENPEVKDDDLDAEKVDEGESTAEPKAEKILKKRGRKPKAKKKVSASKHGKSSSSIKQPDELAQSHKSNSEDIPPSPKESFNDAAGHSSAKATEACDGPLEEIYGESGDKFNGSPKSKTEISSSENPLLLDEKATTSAGDLKAETTTPTVDISGTKNIVSVVDASAERTSALNDENPENTTTLANDASQEGAAPTKEEQMEEIETSEGKSTEQVSVPSEDTRKVEEDSLKTEVGIKKRGRGKGKATLKKLATQAAVEDNNKEATTSHKSALKPVDDEVEMKESPKTSNKRKHIETNSNESKDYGEELVGSKVKVWWPADKRFYKGVIESFDSAKKKHKVLYADGEVENLFLKKQRWEVIDPDEDSDTQDEETHQESPATEKHPKAKEADEGTSKKRLGRPPSIKSKSASNKLGRKPKDEAKSDSKSRDESKGAKSKTENPKEEEESKAESSKRLGRPRADASKSTSKSTADEPSSNAVGKSKAGESKLADKGTAEDAKSSGKPKGGGDSKTSTKGASDSNMASNLEGDNSSKRKETKGKGTKSGNATSVIKSAGKSKTKEPSKSKSGSAAKEDAPKAVSDAKSEGLSQKTAPKKSGVKAPASVEADRSGSEGEEAAEEQTSSPVKASGSSKRKASLLEKGNKSGAKHEVKGKKGRKN